MGDVSDAGNGRIGLEKWGCHTFQERRQGSGRGGGENEDAEGMADCWWWGGHFSLVGGLWVNHFAMRSGLIMKCTIYHDLSGWKRFLEHFLRGYGYHCGCYENRPLVSFRDILAWRVRQSAFAMDSSSPSIAVSYDSIERDVDL